MNILLRIWTSCTFVTTGNGKILVFSYCSPNKTCIHDWTVQSLSLHFSQTRIKAALNYTDWLPVIRVIQSIFAPSCFKGEVSALAALSSFLLPSPADYVQNGNAGLSGYLQTACLPVMMIYLSAASRPPVCNLPGSLTDR